MKVLDNLAGFLKKKLPLKLAKNKQNYYKNHYNKGSRVYDKNLKILQMVTWHFTKFLPKEIEILKLVWSNDLFCNPWSNFHFIGLPKAQFWGDYLQTPIND